LSNSMAIERRLAAILAADVAGYSRLMGADEIATLQALTDRRRILVATIAANRGRVANTAGDSVLAEFPSVVDAVTCAVSVQSKLSAANSGTSADRQINFRIGVHVGDVMPKEGDLFGDGVNIAARLESEAPPGGIIVSSAVREAAEGRIRARFDALGELILKNIEHPVGAFRLAWEPDEWQMPEPDPELQIELTPSHKVTSGTASSGRPSIAVLPFQNLGGDPEQEYFVDGLAEDIINELSRFRSLFVIARNSSFAYKGRAVDVRQVSRELGVRYVLEGSVRRSATRVRVATQLIDAATGASMWAERYDFGIEDLFVVQDELMRKITAVLPGRLESAELTNVTRKTSDSLEAYDFLLRGKFYHHLETPEANREAEACFDQSIARDPAFAQAIAWKACALGQAWSSEYWPRDPARFAEINRLVRRALELDENDPECHRIICRISLTQRQFDKSERHLERALALTPNDPRLIVQRGINSTYLGDSEAALPWIEQAMRVDPFSAARYETDLVRALYATKRVKEAVTVLEGSTRTHYDTNLWRAACYIEIAREEEAQLAIREALASRPHLTVRSVMDGQPWKRPQDAARVETALSRAGLPR
jgi:adenylate cyclase